MAEEVQVVMAEEAVGIAEAVQVVIVGAVIDLEVVQAEAVPVVIEAVVINQVVVMVVGVLADIEDEVVAECKQGQ